MEYQIETLHIYGDKHPESGLKNKVKRKQFKEGIEVIDPITFEKTKHPLKQFMVSQMQIGFERDRFVLSPYDDILYKQLVDYKVEKFGTNRLPIYTDKNEHYIDAMGLAYLAFVLEFKEIVNVMKDIEVSSMLVSIQKGLGVNSVNKIFKSIQSTYESSNKNNPYYHEYDPNEPKSEQNMYINVPVNYKRKNTKSNWGSRSSSMKGFGGRSMW